MFFLILCIKELPGGQKIINRLLGKDLR
jgi:cytochrome b involved in lipid metabolism